MINNLLLKIIEISKFFFHYLKLSVKTDNAIFLKSINYFLFYNKIASRKFHSSHKYKYICQSIHSSVQLLLTHSKAQDKVLNFETISWDTCYQLFLCLYLILNLGSNEQISCFCGFCLSLQNFNLWKVSANKSSNSSSSNRDNSQNIVLLLLLTLRSSFHFHSFAYKGDLNFLGKF